MSVPHPSSVPHDVRRRRRLRLRRRTSLGLLVALSVGAASAGSEILQCRGTDGSVVLTDAAHCPTGSALVRRETFVPSTGGAPSAAERQRRAAAIQSGTASGAQRSVPTPAQQRVAQARVAACEDLADRKQDIDARMRAGYDSREGERFREQLRRIEADRCRLDCVPC